MKTITIILLCFSILSCVPEKEKDIIVTKDTTPKIFKDTVIIYLQDKDLQFYRALVMSSWKDGEYFQTRTLIATGQKNKWAVRLVYNKEVKK